MKDIMLKITGRTVSALPINPEDPQNKNSAIEFMTSGKISTSGEVTEIFYEESEFSGMEGCETHITISGGKLCLRRSGNNKELDPTVLEFEEGKRYEGYYPTPYGNVGLELLTNRIDFGDPKKANNKISIDYSLSLKGLVESRNTIEIEVLQ